MSWRFATKARGQHPASVATVCCTALDSIGRRSATGRPITRDAVGQACNKASLASGITKPITPHSLRHAFATHMLERGVDVRRIQLLMGHRSLATTSRYLRVTTSTICATTSPLDLLPDLEPVQPRAPEPTHF